MISLRHLCLNLAILLFAVSLTAGELAPNLSGEASLSGSKTENLFSDSSGSYCHYRSSSLDLDYTLLPFVQLNLGGEYTYYRQVNNLSNLRYGGGVTLIPTPDSSRFNIIVSANAHDRKYRDIETDTGAVNANEFTGREYDALFGIGYDLTQSIQLRASFSFASQRYGIDGVIDRETKDAALGANFTLLDRFSLDLELGGSTGKYQYIDPWYEPIPGTVLPRSSITPGEQYDILLVEDLKSYYFTPRVSTSIGHRVGLSLTYMARNFQKHDQDHIIYGYSSGYLSPWNGTFDGQAIALSVKSYLIPRLIVSLHTGYWDKTYIRVAEYEYWLSGGIVPRPREGVNLDLAKDRSDYRSRTSVTIKMPLAHSTGYFVEPSLTFDYLDNKSTVAVYDFHDFSVSAGLTIRF